MKVRIFSKIDDKVAELNLPAELIQLYYASDGIFEIESLDKFLDDYDNYVKVRKMKNMLYYGTAAIETVEYQIML